MYDPELMDAEPRDATEDSIHEYYVALARCGSTMQGVNTFPKALGKTFTLETGRQPTVYAEVIASEPDPKSPIRHVTTYKLKL